MSNSSNDRVSTADTIDVLVLIVDFLKMLPRMWGLLLLCIIIGGGLSYAKAYVDYRPVYTAYADFKINIKKEQSISGDTTFYNNAAARQMAKTFPTILTSGLLGRTVAADMGVASTASVSAEVTPDTNLLRISVTDFDPVRAHDTLESVIRCYPSVSEPIIGKVEMTLLDESGVPDEPDNDKIFIKEALLGIAIGMAVGLGWSVLVFVTNRTIQYESDIKKKLGINCLGTVPKIVVKKRSRKVEQYFLMTDSNMKDILTEPLRMIKNKVEYHAHKHKHKTFLVTSATAGEGKSLFATNLSLSLASAGKKVVLIDCDLRHPTGRVIFNMEEGTGLGEYLQGDISLMDYLKSAQAENNHDFPNFLFLPGGEALDDGSYLLSSDKISDLIACVESKADYVILDSAPTGLLTDSAVLAKSADAAIMLIRKGFARIDFINDALGHLVESDIHVVGGVLNDV